MKRTAATSLDESAVACHPQSTQHRSSAYSKAVTINVSWRWSLALLAVFGELGALQTYGTRIVRPTRGKTSSSKTLSIRNNQESQWPFMITKQLYAQQNKKDTTKAHCLGYSSDWHASPTSPRPPSLAWAFSSSLTYLLIIILTISIRLELLETCVFLRCPLWFPPYSNQMFGIIRSFQPYSLKLPYYILTMSLMKLFESWDSSWHPSWSTWHSPVNLTDCFDLWRISCMSTVSHSWSLGTELHRFCPWYWCRFWVFFFYRRGGRDSDLSYRLQCTSICFPTWSSASKWSCNA